MQTFLSKMLCEYLYIKMSKKAEAAAETTTAI
jgi:hypothetical protein